MELSSTFTIDDVGFKEDFNCAQRFCRNRSTDINHLQVDLMSKFVLQLTAWLIVLLL